MKQQKPVPPKLPEPDLCDQYGKIGISAVAAAVLYQGDAKISQHTPPKTQTDRREDEEPIWSSAA